MHLQLDPLVPLVWRTPTSLQFGVDLPRLVLDDVSVLDEVMLAALRSGTRRTRLHELAAGAGGSADDVDAMLAELDAVMVRAAPQQQHPLASILIDGDGATAALLTDSLGRDGFAVQHASGGAIDLIDTTPDLVVIVANYVVQPRRYGRWLRTDVPHLPVVFGDGGVRVGPLVQPGTGPCLYCLDLEHTDHDAAWPALASQLSDRAAPSETPHAARLAAGLAGSLVTERLRHRAEQSARSERWSGSSVHIAPDGWLNRVEHSPHPQCGCRLGSGDQSR